MDEILLHYKKEIFSMYTKEDYIRDHPPGPKKHFFFPWEEEYHLQELKKEKEIGLI